MIDKTFPKVETYDGKLISDFSSFWLGITPYSYQQSFLDACSKHNRVAGLWCRQSGKSTTVAIYSTFKATTDCVSIIIVAPTQSQSSEMFDKIRNFVTQNQTLFGLLEKSTETELKFVNGSRVLSLPSGPHGVTIVGYTADILIIEEAGLMKDEIVNRVLMPMIASKKGKGQVIKVGTPRTRNHFYRSCYKDENYKVVKVKWENVIEAGQYEKTFIEEQKQGINRLEFSTEYEAEFIDDLYAFFPSDIIDLSMANYSLFPKI